MKQMLSQMMPASSTGSTQSWLLSTSLAGKEGGREGLRWGAEQEGPPDCPPSCLPSVGTLGSPTFPAPRGEEFLSLCSTQMDTSVEAQQVTSVIRGKMPLFFQICLLVIEDTYPLKLTSSNRSQTERSGFRCCLCNTLNDNLG